MRNVSVRRTSASSSEKFELTLKGAGARPGRGHDPFHRRRLIAFDHQAQQGFHRIGESFTAAQRRAAVELSRIETVSRHLAEGALHHTVVNDERDPARPRLGHAVAEPAMKVSDAVRRMRGISMRAIRGAGSPAMLSMRSIMAAALKEQVPRLGIEPMVEELAHDILTRSPLERHLLVGALSAEPESWSRKRRDDVDFLWDHRAASAGRGHCRDLPYGSKRQRAKRKASRPTRRCALQINKHFPFRIRARFRSRSFLTSENKNPRQITRDAIDKRIRLIRFRLRTTSTRFGSRPLTHLRCSRSWPCKWGRCAPRGDATSSSMTFFPHRLKSAIHEMSYRPRLP
jgi:hypothetical protein